MKTTHANPNKHRSPRRRSREFALQALYEWLLNTDDAAVIVEHIRGAYGFGKADVDHFQTLVYETIAQASELRSDLAPHLDRSIDELSPVEHATLLLGANELKNHLEIPYRVVINEAVELAKSFGGMDGHKFVNGVLDKLAPKLRAAEVGTNQ